MWEDSHDCPATHTGDCSPVYQHTHMHATCTHISSRGPCTQSHDTHCTRRPPHLSHTHTVPISDVRSGPQGTHTYTPRLTAPHHGPSAPTAGGCSCGAHMLWTQAQGCISYGMLVLCLASAGHGAWPSSGRTLRVLGSPQFVHPPSSAALRRKPKHMPGASSLATSL